MSLSQGQQWLHSHKQSVGVLSFSFLKSQHYEFKDKIILHIAYIIKGKTGSRGNVISFESECLHPLLATGVIQLCHRADLISNLLWLSYNLFLLCYQVSCPGVHLPAKNDIYLSMCFMGQHCQSESLPAVFPLLLHEKCTFEKAYVYLLFMRKKHIASGQMLSVVLVIASEMSV